MKLYPNLKIQVHLKFYPFRLHKKKDTIKLEWCKILVQFRENTLSGVDMSFFKETVGVSVYMLLLLSFDHPQNIIISLFTKELSIVSSDS